MKEKIFLKLKEAEKICNEEEKSTEYMIQYMQDYANVSYDCVMSYLWQTRDK